MIRIKKIRTKLLSLVSGVVFFMALAIGVYLTLISPIQKIRAERQVLSDLNSALKSLQLEINKLLITGVVTEAPLYKAGREGYAKAFEAVAGLKVLPSLNPAMAESIGVITKVKDLSAQALDDLDTSYGAIAASISQGGQDSPPLSFSAILTGDKASIAGVVLPLMIFSKKITDANFIFNIGEKSLGEQFVVIDGVIAATEKRAIMVSALAAGIIVVLTLLAAILFSSNISRNIEGLDGAIADLKTGDLSARFGSKSHDELGRLALNLNSFLEVLVGFHGRIRQASGQNIQVKDELQKAVANTMSSAEEIEANTRAIATQMHTLDGLSTSSKKAVDSVKAAVTTFVGQVDGENRLVSDSVVAITEMLQGISNIARITEEDRELADALVAESKRGRAVFEESFERINGITDSIGAIQEMASLIQNVAAQTNLLAMNAAIEAAHAGQYGKGFAVVADEIRKLAETSNKSSRDISLTIRDVTTKIRDAGGTKKATGDAFSAISARIVEVSRSISEIYANVAEMQTGGKQILEAMADLKGRSEDIRNRSQEFDSSTNELQNGMDMLIRITSEVVGNIGEISAGIQYIGDSIRGIAGQAEHLESTSRELDTEIGRFRTSDQPPSA